MSKLTAIILVASSARTSDGESSVALIFYNEDHVIDSPLRFSHNKVVTCKATLKSTTAFSLSSLDSRIEKDR